MIAFSAFLQQVKKQTERVKKMNRCFFALKIEKMFVVDMHTNTHTHTLSLSHTHAHVEVLISLGVFPEGEKQHLPPTESFLPEKRESKVKQDCLEPVSWTALGGLN